MDTERNLLLGALAFQAGLIDADQFVEACRLWSEYKTSALVMVLIKRGWIQPLDEANLEYLLERRLDKCGGNVTASLASVGDEVKRHLAALEDADIQRTLTTLVSPERCDSTLTVLSAERSQREVQGWQEVQRRQAEEERDMLCTAGFDGYFKRVNPAFERVLGYTKGELLAQPYVSFIHSDDRESTLTEARKLLEGRETVFFENRYRCKDGSYKWLQWSAIPDMDHQLTYAAARDITERKRALEALQESEARYRSVIAAIQDGIALLDSTGAIQACNASAEHILGLSADQMMGRTARDARWGAIHEGGTPFPDEKLPAIVTLRTGNPCFNVIMGLRKPNGDLRWISINSQPLFEADEKTVSGVVASFSDITDRKQTEEAFRKTSARLTNANRSLRQRLRAASHTSHADDK